MNIIKMFDVDFQLLLRKFRTLYVLLYICPLAELLVDECLQACAFCIVSHLWVGAVVSGAHLCRQTLGT